MTDSAGQRPKTDPFAAGQDNPLPTRQIKTAFKKVMREIGRGTPLIAVVGPAGTGKTLLLDLVRRACLDQGKSVRLVARGDLAHLSRGVRSDVLLIDEADSVADTDLAVLLSFEGVAYASTVALAFVRSDLPPALDPSKAAIVRIAPLSRQDARAYAVEDAAGAGRPDLFEPEALDLLASASAASPRLLRSIGSLALFFADREDAPRIAARHVEAALRAQVASPADDTRKAAPPAVVVPAFPLAARTAALGRQIRALGRNVGGSVTVGLGLAALLASGIVLLATIPSREIAVTGAEPGTVTVTEPASPQARSGMAWNGRRGWWRHHGESARAAPTTQGLLPIGPAEASAPPAMETAELAILPLAPFSLGSSVQAPFGVTSPLVAASTAASAGSVSADAIRLASDVAALPSDVVVGKKRSKEDATADPTVARVVPASVEAAALKPTRATVARAKPRVLALRAPAPQPQKRSRKRKAGDGPAAVEQAQQRDARGGPVRASLDRADTLWTVKQAVPLARAAKDVQGVASATQAARESLSQASAVKDSVAQVSAVKEAATQVTGVAQDIVSTTKDVASTTKDVVSTTKDVASATKDVASTTKDVVSTTKDVASTTKDVVGTTKDVVSTTKDVVGTTKDVVSTTKDVASTTKDVVSTTKDVASTTKDVVSTTKDVVSTTKDVASTTKDVVGIVTSP